MSLSACASYPPAEPVETALRCPELPGDIIAESRRKPVIQGTTALEVSGNLVLQAKRKNRALRRSIAAYDECRKT
jgi:hypothetical protein